MAAVLLPSTKLALNVFAALEGQKAGNANLTGHKAFIDANGSAAYTAALEGHFAPTSDADLANSLLTNLGLGSLFTQAQAEAFLAGNPGNRVGAILALADQLYDYNGTDAALLSAHNTYKASVDGAYEYSINPANVASEPLVNDPGTISLNGADTAAGTAAGGEVLHITGDQSVRIDITNPANQIKGLDLNGDGVIAADGVENNITGKASLFEIIDAYARNPLNEAGYPTTDMLDPLKPLAINTIMAVAPIPEGFDKVKLIEATDKAGHIRIVSTSGRRVTVAVNWEFLHGVVAGR